MRISKSAAESNTGRKRRHNEDSFVHAPPMFAVADGMGGAQAGEVASSLAAEALLEGYVDPAVGGEARIVELIRAARRVHERATHDAAASGMGTTMTVAVFDTDGTIVIGHVGDSRLYRLREGELEQLTDDHSLVAELVRRGELTPAEARVHPQRSVITRALGTESDVQVDAFTVQAHDGDVYLLCSDGLTTMIDAETVADLLQRHRLEPEAATRALIKAANDRGGEDNITAVVFSIADGDAEIVPVAATVAQAAAHDPDDEDTLHPEDGVRLPELDHPPADVTMVVPARAIQDALAAAAAPAWPEPAGTATAEAFPVDSVAAWGSLETLPEPEPAGEEVPKAGFVRVLIALLVIVALAALIVLLVLEELPR